MVRKIGFEPILYGPKPHVLAVKHYILMAFPQGLEPRSFGSKPKILSIELQKHGAG